VYTTVPTAVYGPCNGPYTAVYGSCTLNNSYQISNRLIVTGNRNNIEIFLFL